MALLFFIFFFFGFCPFEKDALAYSSCHSRTFPLQGSSAFPAARWTFSFSSLMVLHYITPLLSLVYICPSESVGGTPAFLT